LFKCLYSIFVDESERSCPSAFRSSSDCHIGCFSLILNMDGPLNDLKTSRVGNKSIIRDIWIVFSFQDNFSKWWSAIFSIVMNKFLRIFS
jgi:hypothetical protein